MSGPAVTVLTAAAARPAGLPDSAEHLAAAGVEEIARAMRVAAGTFVVILDAGMRVDPAFWAALEHLAGDPHVQAVYADEETSHDGGGTFRKPDFSPSRLRNQPYLGAAVALRADTVRDVGGLRPECRGAALYDLCLKIGERGGRFLHLPEVLWHHDRPIAGFGADLEQAADAVREHCGRVGIDAEVRPDSNGHTFRLIRRRPEGPSVSVVIPTRGSAAEINGEPRVLVVEAVRSMLREGGHEPFEVVVVADTAMAPEVAGELSALLGPRLRLVWFDRPFNFSEKINVGALEARGTHLLLLNDDTEVITPDWMGEMAAVCQDPGVGMVGCTLLFEDGTVQHGGHCYEGGLPDHIAFRAERNDPGYFRAMRVEREVSGVTAACALLPRALFLQIGGMCMALPGNYNDVDLCLKVRNEGKRIVFTPHAALFHYESKSRDSNVATWEGELVRGRWYSRMVRDPYWDREAGRPPP